jgi:hypothetical protein
MSEQIVDSHAELGSEASRDDFLAVSKELELKPEIVEQITKLSPSKKEECIASLEEIAKEVKEKNIGNVDRDKKIKITLADEY